MLPWKCNKVTKYYASCWVVRGAKGSNLSFVQITRPIKLSLSGRSLNFYEFIFYLWSLMGHLKMSMVVVNYCSLVLITIIPSIYSINTVSSGIERQSRSLQMNLCLDTEELACFWDRAVKEYDWSCQLNGDWLWCSLFAG